MLLELAKGKFSELVCEFLLSIIIWCHCTHADTSTLMDNNVCYARNAQHSDHQRFVVLYRIIGVCRVCVSPFSCCLSSSEHCLHCLFPSHLASSSTLRLETSSVRSSQHLLNLKCLSSMGCSHFVHCVVHFIGSLCLVMMILLVCSRSAPVILLLVVLYGNVDEYISELGYS